MFLWQQGDVCHMAVRCFSASCHLTGPISHGSHYRAGLERIERKGFDHFAAESYLQSRNLRFEMSAGRVTLHGQVASWYQKQMAQESLLRLDGIDRVENQLEVCWS